MMRSCTRATRPQLLLGPLETLLIAFLVLDSTCTSVVTWPGLGRFCCATCI
jgi:hypothetical protein